MNNTDKATIVRLPDYTMLDEHCSVCGDDNVVIVIEGGQKCNYCGNRIVLCSKHYYQMLKEAITIGGASLIELDEIIGTSK
jgi:DNA-directed RNA polymerase subunit RPC12/RpoP